MDSRFTQLINKLREQGHRMTPQRAAILKAFAENPSHPTVEQVYEQVRREFPMTSLATVYKTVAMLKEQGEIIEISLGAGSSRYDAARLEPHAHLICTGCSRIVDVDDSQLAVAPEYLAEKYGFNLHSQRVDYYGLCPSCQAAGQSQNQP
ncbi:MAG TPA: transcriptional repressor [Anaerolineaceae bacterium]|jgi:Fur family peroxide stress response transcriptional regulator|nr:transcriptional repressor [Anaerolineaceae bacterium]